MAELCGCGHCPSPQGTKPRCCLWQRSKGSTAMLSLPAAVAGETERAQPASYRADSARHRHLADGGGPSIRDIHVAGPIHGHAWSLIQGRVDGRTTIVSLSSPD